MSADSQLTFLDFFAGIGGFRRGMEMAGHKCLGFCEWDKFASASYRSMHTITEEQRAYLAKMDLKKRQKEILKEEYLNGEWYSNDIRNVHSWNVPRADCWCFGAPCQDFSLAGKRAGLEGERSSLVREIFRILGEMPEEERPEWLFYENVKGMLSSNRGFDFIAILLEMDRGGYDIQWQILNSKNFGVPQNRERVFTVGHLRRYGTAEVFPVEGTDGADCIHGVGHRDGYRRNTQVFDPDGITETLDTAAGGGRGHHTIVSIDKQDDESKRVAIPVLTPDRETKNQNGRRLKEDGEESFTLTAMDRHGVAVGVDDLYANREPRFYDQEAPTMRSDRQGLKVAVEVEPTGTVGYNATRNQGGGITQTANTLMARDYKGLGNQMMTAACLLLTRESVEKSEKSQTASKPEKTGDCQTEAQKGR